MFHSIRYRSSTFSIDGATVRLISPKDAAGIAAYYRRNRTFLKPWEPLRNETFYTEEGWEKRLRQIGQLHKHKLAYYFVIVRKDTNEISGVINYSNLVRQPFFAGYVGYSLDKESQGMGLMRNGLKVTLDWMFEVQNFHRIMASFMPRNNKSSAVLQSLGFEFEGEAKDYLLINGKWEDHVLTSRRNPDWNPAHDV